MRLHIEDSGGSGRPVVLIHGWPLSAESWAPPPQLWIFGAVDFTAALAKVAKVLGYRVTVCDARPVFATRARFPAADEVVVSWPGGLFDQRGTQLGQRDAVAIRLLAQSGMLALGAYLADLQIHPEVLEGAQTVGAVVPVEPPPPGARHAARP